MYKKETTLMNKSASLKKRVRHLLVTTLVAGLAVTQLAGCANPFISRPAEEVEEILSEIMEVEEPTLTVKQIKTEDTVEVGGKFEFNPEKYFEIEGDPGSGIRINLGEFTAEKIGDYEITIECLEDKYTVTIHVVDTTSPVIKMDEDLVFANCSEVENFEQFYETLGITAEDITETNTEVIAFKLYKDFKALKKQTIDEIKDEIVLAHDNKELFDESVYGVEEPSSGAEDIAPPQEEPSSEPAEEAEEETEEFPLDLSQEGFYAGLVKVTDEGENSAEKLFVLVNDLTAPEIKNFKDKTVYQDDVSKIPDYNFEGVTVADVVDGDFDAESWTVDKGILDEKKHTYFAKITVSDRAGNTVEKQITVTVSKKQTPVANYGGGGSGSGNGSGGGSGNDPGYDAWWFHDIGNGAAGAPNVDVNAYVNQVFAIVNQRRAEAGVPALTLNSTLCANAAVRAQELVSNMSHTRPDGSDCFSAITISYSCAGENLCAGYGTPENAMNAWMNSEGHRNNILNPSFTNIGIGLYYNPDTDYKYHWIQIFTG